jgi:uncharacterized protein YdeI (YjbR/CyaY-like superfamily)
MNIGKTLTVTNRTQWRRWLAKNHRTASEIWLVYFKKESGRKRIPYNNAVEEALCYGWIDSTAKTIDEKRFAQRFSPRKPNSVLSDMNKERIRRLITAKKMTRAGLSAIERHLQPDGTLSARFVVPPDILHAIKLHPLAWKHFRRFPLSYKRIRIGWIDGSRKRPVEFAKRLTYFISMTEQNKQFGMVR